MDTDKTNHPARWGRHFSAAAAVLTLLAASPGLADSPPKTRSPARPVENQPANPHLPSLFLIGDSTVRNGAGKGDGGQWGWGDFLAPYFKTNEINVVNRALGGTSSRTFYRDQWPRVAALLKPGDFVILQFGHNDKSPINDTNRARGTLRGVADHPQIITNLVTKKVETVHSFGWYEQAIIAEARAVNPPATITRIGESARRRQSEKQNTSSAERRLASPCARRTRYITQMSRASALQFLPFSRCQGLSADESRSGFLVGARTKRASR